MIKNLICFMRAAPNLKVYQKQIHLGVKRREYRHDQGSIVQNVLSSRSWNPTSNFVVAIRQCSTKSGRKNYYSILGVTPHATQAQIKEAYYKLSMKHHPDRHSGSDEATDRFQEISEAYSILGDHDLRKKYDRGLVIDGKMSRPQQERKPKPKPSIQKYDFDEWTRMHYQEAMKRRQRNLRDRYEEELEKSRHKMREGTQRLVISGVVFAVILLVYLFEKKSPRNELDRYLKKSDT